MNPMLTKRQYKNILLRGIFWVIMLLVTTLLSPLFGIITIAAANIHSIYAAKREKRVVKLHRTLNGIGMYSMLFLITVLSPFIGVIISGFFIVGGFYGTFSEDALETNYQRYVKQEQEERAAEAELEKPKREPVVDDTVEIDPLPKS